MSVIAESAEHVQRLEQLTALGDWDALAIERFHPGAVDIEAIRVHLNGGNKNGRPKTVAVPEAEPVTSSWSQVDLKALLEGDLSPLEATRMPRSDGVLMLYPGRIHDFHGQPESLKSWCAQVAVAEILMANLEALYIDFEAEARDVVGHLLALGVTKEQLNLNLHYIRPDEPFSEAARTHLISNLTYWTLDISIVDGVNNAMVANGFEPNSNKDIRLWWDLLVRPIQLATRGPSVLIDHVAKDKEHRGDWAVGGGQKLAGIDGASYTFDLVQPFGRGRTGLSRLLLAKDRPGGLRGHAVGKELCRLRLISAEDGTITHDFLVPSGLTEGEDGEARWKPTFYMQKVSELLEQAEEPLPKKAVEAGITGKATYIRQALDVLVADGYVTTSKGPHGSTLHAFLQAYIDPSSSLVPSSSPPRPSPGDDMGSTSSPFGGTPLTGVSPRDEVVPASKRTSSNISSSSSVPGTTRKACPACGAFAFSAGPDGPPQRRCHGCSEVWTP